MSLAVLFPGQGSIVPASGAAWVDRPQWSLVAEVESIAGRAVAPWLLDAPAGELARTDAAQIATLTLSLMAWDALSGVLDEPPVAMAGHSLGQVTALIAAGALAREEGIALAVARADACRACDDLRPGRLAALLGATVEQATAACDGVDECWVANDNAPGQVVIGGTPEGLALASDNARDLGVRKVMPLPVGGAFHTPLLAPAVEAWKPALGSATFRAPAVPVVDNTEARVRRDAGGWPDLLARHLVEPVRWRESQVVIAHELGATELVELAPAGTLTAMAKRTIDEVRILPLTDLLSGVAV
jgi:[acyl-carrier-protein] S-malonyltransferase